MEALPTDVATGVKNLMAKYPEQKHVLLDVFEWRSSSRERGQFFVRDCLSGQILAVQRTYLTATFEHLLASLPLPILGIFPPTRIETLSSPASNSLTPSSVLCQRPHFYKSSPPSIVACWAYRCIISSSREIHEPVGACLIDA